MSALNAMLNEKLGINRISWISSGLINNVIRGITYVGTGAYICNIVNAASNVFRSMDACITFPKKIYDYSREMCLMVTYLPGRNTSFNKLVIKAPIFEEFIFRFSFQEILLKKLPKIM